MRIHISNNTKVALDELGGYEMEYRGSTEIKVYQIIIDHQPSNNKFYFPINIIYRWKKKYIYRNVV